MREPIAHTRARRSPVGGVGGGDDARDARHIATRARRGTDVVVVVVVAR